MSKWSILIENIIICLAVISYELTLKSLILKIVDLLLVIRFEKVQVYFSE